METLSLRQASIFLQEKYRAARLAFTDVSEAELWTEKVTANSILNPDTKTMTQIAEASYDFDDYWRIVDLLHKRLDNVDWSKWRQYYNTLILLEFLITHGPEDFVVEFKCDIGVIRELGTFRHIDNRGFNWGIYMKKKVERILVLMQGGQLLEDARSKAIKLTNEIQGFGSSSSSTYPSSTSSPPSSWRSSFDSSSPSSHAWHDINEPNKHQNEVKQALQHDMFEPSTKGEIQHKMPRNFLDDGLTMNDILDWKSNQETIPEISTHDDYGDHKSVGFLHGFCSKHFGYSPLEKDSEKAIYRSLSDVGREKKKILDHQPSLGY